MSVVTCYSCSWSNDDYYFSYNYGHYFCCPECLGIYLDKVEDEERSKEISERNDRSS